MAFMSQHGDASVVRLAAKEARRQEEERCREEARRLREEQDQEYQESLQKDQQRSSLSAARRRSAQELPKEATAPRKDGCHLVLRFPCGRRAERGFTAEQTLSEVYDWADCAGELAALSGGTAFEVPEKFLLATTYPKAVLKDQKKTLRQLKLLPSAVLTVCPE